MQTGALKAVALAAVGLFMFGAQAIAGDCGALKLANADADQTLEPAEAKKAAAEKWKKITAGKNKAEEFEARLGSKELAEGTAGEGVTEKEYVEIASTMFSAADADKNGSLDCKELESDVGQNLQKLLK